MVKKHHEPLALAFAVVTAAMAIFGWSASASAQSITEYPIPSPASGNQPIAGIATGSDGALWFTDGNGNRIVRVTTAGTFTEFHLPTPSSNSEDITAGPDGALWFTEAGANKIGRITTADMITEYVIPTSGSVPIGIAAGSDGALWFAEGIGNKIGRVTTAGEITEYAIPTPRAPRLVSRQGRTARCGLLSRTAIRSG
jgi:virginiamycin B lyase